MKGSPVRVQASAFIAFAGIFVESGKRSFTTPSIATRLSLTGSGRSQTFSCRRRPGVAPGAASPRRSTTRARTVAASATAAAARKASERRSRGSPPWLSTSRSGLSMPSLRNMRLPAATPARSAPGVALWRRDGCHVSRERRVPRGEEVWDSVVGLRHRRSSLAACVLYAVSMPRVATGWSPAGRFGPEPPELRGTRASALS
jgi:hypothetical protein